MKVELELEAAAGGGSRVLALSAEAPVVNLGRGELVSGGGSRDRTVSRRHVSLRLLDDGGVAFEVVGRNPVLVRRPSNGGGGSGSGIKVCRPGEKGELRPGDALSLSLKEPSFWAVRRKGWNGDGKVEASVLDAVARRETRTRERKERERLAAEVAEEGTKEEAQGEAGSESEVEGPEIGIASIDPVAEFGFLSVGHEFDSYPKGRIRPPKDWNWFLEDMNGSSDDEDDEISGSRSRSKGWDGNKKKKDGEGEDEDWADDNEDNESLSRGPSVKRTKYATRSKDPKKKPRKENSKVKNGNNKDKDEDVEEEEDEEDETLGGFIVNEDDEPMDELSEDEEEEFDDEDDDD